jgi:hypothetical protein
MIIMNLGSQNLVKSNLANVAEQRATPTLATGYPMTSLPTTQSIYAAIVNTKLSL